MSYSLSALQDAMDDLLLQADGRDTDAHRVSSMLLRDGRVLAWHSYGDANGHPLYVFHGFPGSGLQISLFHEQALRLGLHLIAPDRPGFGGSSPHPLRDIEDWPDDMEQLSSHLGHARIGVVGVSCGGPYALACAQTLPERVFWAATLGGMGAMHQRELRSQQLPALRLLFGLARIHPNLCSPFLALDAGLFRFAPERALKSLIGLLSEPDRILLQGNPVVRSRFAASFADAYRQGITGARTEAGLIARYRGDGLASIRIPVHLHQAGHDRHVPPDMGRHLAASMPQACFHFHPGEGHLTVAVNHFAGCGSQYLETL